MRTLKTSEAAALLHVSPNTLRAWERRFGFPRPQRSPGKQRVYSQPEITALSDALAEGLSISSAVSVARDTHGDDVHTLLSALTSFRGPGADEAMESSLVLRSVESSLVKLLLPALEGIRQRQGPTSATWAFGAGWAQDWLLRARRLSPRLIRRGALLIGDASHTPLDPARIHTLALELCCVRAGVDVLMLPTCATRHLRQAALALDPWAVVIAGSSAPDDEVASWAYAVRSAVGRLPIGLYHRRLDLPSTRWRAHELPREPLAALADLLEILDREDRGDPVTGPETGHDVWSHSPARAPALSAGA